MENKLSMDFLNTRWYLTHKLNKEILADPVLLNKFLEIHQLQVETPYSIKVKENLLEVRTFLAKILEDYVKDNSISLEAIKKINDYLVKSTYQRTVEKSKHEIKLAIKPVLRDWNWIMSEIVFSFVELIEYGDKNRIKICENPDCKWVFYDETKSRTKRWCDDKCASLMKVRKFRAKKKDHFHDCGNFAE